MTGTLGNNPADTSSNFIVLVKYGQIDMEAEIKPIDINIMDNRRYRLIASFVDKDSFLEDIHKARTKLGIKLSDRQKKSSMTGSNHAISQVSLQKIVAKLLLKYNKGAIYKGVILSSILKHVVTDDDFKPPPPTIWLASEYLTQNTITLDFPQIGIVIDPETDISNLTKNVEEAIMRKETKKKKKERKKREKKKGKKEIIKRHNTPAHLAWYLPDTANMVRRDRKWYWGRKSGKSNLQIATDDTEERGKLESKSFEGTVKEAVKSYRNMVKGKT